MRTLVERYSDECSVAPVAQKAEEALDGLGQAVGQPSARGVVVLGKANGPVVGAQLARRRTRVGRGHVRGDALRHCVSRGPHQDWVVDVASGRGGVVEQRVGRSARPPGPRVLVGRVEARRQAVAEAAIGQLALEGAWRFVAHGRLDVRLVRPHPEQQRVVLRGDAVALLARHREAVGARKKAPPVSIRRVGLLREAQHLDDVGQERIETATSSRRRARARRARARSGHARAPRACGARVL